MSGPVSGAPPFPVGGRGAVPAPVAAYATRRSSSVSSCASSDDSDNPRRRRGGVGSSPVLGWGLGLSASRSTHRPDVGGQPKVRVRRMGLLSPCRTFGARPGAAARRAGAGGGSREQDTLTARQRRTGTRDTAAGGDNNYGNSRGGSREQDAPTARRRSANPGTRGAKNVTTESGGHDGGVTLCTIAETTERPVRPGGGGDAPPRERACQEKDSRRHGTRGEDGGPDWGTRGG